MAQVAAYHRPHDLDQAIDLLADPARTVLAGGTIVNADREPPAVEVVDLQALGLDAIEAEPDAEAGPVRLGAMVTLDRLAAEPALPEWLRELAKAELPSTLRTVATVGGTVAAGEAESALVAGLLAAGATIELAGGGQPVPLGQLLADGLPAGGLITAVVVETIGQAAVATTARTPADIPIVAAVARRAGAATTLALSGVADHPVLVDPADPAAGLEPPGDFRGSPSYRRHLAQVLSARALEAIDG